MLTERFTVARKYLDDAHYLLAARRLESAVSRAYYAAYQAMWAALGDPPSGEQWRHLGIIGHFVRGYWCEPAHPPTGPGLLEHLRLPFHRLDQFRIDADDDLIALDITKSNHTTLVHSHKVIARPPDRCAVCREGVTFRNADDVECHE